MDYYKEYLYQISKVEYQTPYLMVTWQYPPFIFKKYIPKFQNIPFEESKFNAYYGEVRKHCTGFVFCYDSFMYKAQKYADKLSNTLTLAEMMDLFQKTVEILDNNHEIVVDEFHPLNSERQRRHLDGLVSRYTKYREELLKFGTNLAKMYNEKDVRAFAKDHFKICLQRYYEMGEFTCGFIARMIAEHLYNIRVSIEDILHRIQKNSDLFHKNYEHDLSLLFNEMYERNKDYLNIIRRNERHFSEMIEMKNKIEKIKHKIQTFGNLETFDRLTSEIKFWSTKLKDFEGLAASITKVKPMLENAKKQAEIYSNYKCRDLPGSKTICWENMGENFTKQKQHLEDVYTAVCVPLVSFFVCKGLDRVVYKDSIGKYNIDDFGHLNYMKEFGAKVYHVKCDGSFVENFEDDKYYFDKCGRYILENGEKIFQLAPCTNKFRLGDKGVFQKICSCAAQCHDVPEMCDIDIEKVLDGEWTPDQEPVDIKNTLDAETVKYLWDTYGYILPEVLCEVADSKPKNPIHQLAHVLITKKFNMSYLQVLEKKIEAIDYRDNIHKERKEKAAAAVLAWKSKLGKPCKPEHFDNVQQEAITSQQEEDQRADHFLNEYCYNDYS